jgi:hypothetical protein
MVIAKNKGFKLLYLKEKFLCQPFFTAFHK